MNKKRRYLYCLIFTGLFSALIFVGTFFFKIPAVGYVHLGDGLIFIAAATLPLPYAALAAAIGGALSDLLGGYAIWIPGTILIKAVCVLLFKSRSKKMLCLRNVMAIVYASAVNVCGYYVYGSLIQGNFIACLAEIPMNLMQEAFGAVIFILVAAVLDANRSIRDFVQRKIYGNDV